MGVHSNFLESPNAVTIIKRSKNSPAFLGQTGFYALFNPVAKRAYYFDDPMLSALETGLKEEDVHRLASASIPHANAATGYCVGRIKTFEGVASIDNFLENLNELPGVSDCFSSGPLTLQIFNNHVRAHVKGSRKGQAVRNTSLAHRVIDLFCQPLDSSTREFPALRSSRNSKGHPSVHGQNRKGPAYDAA